MTRQLKDSGNAYRVRLQHLTADGRDTYATQFLGPYATAGTARGQITRNARHWGREGRKFRATVERAVTNWEAI